MSVRAGARAGETTDNHGQRPCEPATSTFSYVLTADGQWFSSREQR
jgi:hypothetical protein